MHFEAYQLYHIYNRGINSQRIFFQEKNYYYFLRKIKLYINPYCEILAYCLMPNHFHLLISTDERSTSPVKVGREKRNPISEGFRKTLSTYSQGINRQENRKSSLFQQNTRSVEVTDWTSNVHYAEICFFYIHHNPVKAGLVRKAHEWQHSSAHIFRQYNRHSLVNLRLAEQLIDIRWNLQDEDVRMRDYQINHQAPWLGSKDQVYFDGLTGGLSH